MSCKFLLVFCAGEMHSGLSLVLNYSYCFHLLHQIITVHAVRLRTYYLDYYALIGSHRVHSYQRRIQWHQRQFLVAEQVIIMLPPRFFHNMKCRYMNDRERDKELNGCKVLSRKVLEIIDFCGGV